MIQQEDQLPRNWAKATLRDVASPTRPRHKPQDFPDLPFIGMENIEAQSMRLLGTVSASQMKSSAVHFWPGDVLYGRLRPYLNKVYSPNFEGLCSAEFIVFPQSDHLDSSFLKYLLNSSEFVSFASHLNEGDRPRVDFDQIGDYALGLPPLPEQRRIVEAIETQLTRLDAAVAALKRAQANLKRYRASVLKAAVEGRLVETGVRLPSTNGSLLPSIPEHWHWSIWSDLSERVTVGHVGPMKHEYVPDGIPFLRSQNVRENRFSSDGLLFIGQAFHDELSKSRLAPGDLVVVRSGSVGVTCVIPDSLPEANCADLVIIRRPDEVLPQFGSFYMNSVAKGLVREGQVGSALIHFNTKSVAALPVPVPPMEEQVRIVAEVERRLSVVEAQERAIEANLLRAERMRQAILKQAFEGRLVSQDLSDEPASVLLGRTAQQISSSGNWRRQHSKKGAQPDPSLRSDRTE